MFFLRRFRAAAAATRPEIPIKPLDLGPLPNPDPCGGDYRPAHYDPLDLDEWPAWTTLHVGGQSAAQLDLDRFDDLGRLIKPAHAKEGGRR